MTYKILRYVVTANQIDDAFIFFEITRKVTTFDKNNEI